MTKLRTISQAADYIKTVDPDTALTQTAVRRLVVTGKIPSIRAGNKYLISLENLDAYLSGKKAIWTESVGSVRAVEVKARG